MRPPRGHKLDSMARLEQDLARRAREGEREYDRRGGRRGEGRKGRGPSRGGERREGKGGGRRGGEGEGRGSGSGSSSEDEEEDGGRGGGMRQPVNLAEDDLTAVQKQALKFIICTSVLRVPAWPKRGLGPYTWQTANARWHKSTCCSCRCHCSRCHCSLCHCATSLLGACSVLSLPSVCCGR